MVSPGTDSREEKALGLVRGEGLTRGRSESPASFQAAACGVAEGTEMAGKVVCVRWGTLAMPSPESCPRASWLREKSGACCCSSRGPQSTGAPWLFLPWDYSPLPRKAVSESTTICGRRRKCPPLPRGGQAQGSPHPTVGPAAKALHVVSGVAQVWDNATAEGDPGPAGLEHQCGGSDRGKFPETE